MPRRTAADAVVRPVLGQKQVAVQQTMEIAGGIGEMHGDDAVLLLAERAAPLPLDARGFVAFFHVAGFVDDSDRVRRGMVVDDDVLQALAGEVFVPMIEGQETLQVSRRNSGRQGDGLAAFFTKVRQLPIDVCRETVSYTHLRAHETDSY